MDLSLIVPTLNEQYYLPTLLESIKSQRFKWKYEIIIADSNSTDETLSIARTYNCKITEWWLPSIWRNNWAKIATWKWLFFMDSDTKLISEYSLSNYLWKLNSQNYIIWTPYTSWIKEENDFISHWLYNCNFLIYNLSKILWCWWALLIKKSIFKKIWWFNENMKIAEDHDLIKRALKYWKRANLMPVVWISWRRFKKDWYSKTLALYWKRTIDFYRWKKIYWESYFK